MINFTSRPLYPKGKRPETHCIESREAPERLGEEQPFLLLPEVELWITQPKPCPYRDLNEVWDQLMFKYLKEK